MNEKLDLTVVKSVEVVEVITGWMPEWYEDFHDFFLEEEVEYIVKVLFPNATVNVLYGQGEHLVTLWGDGEKLGEFPIDLDGVFDRVFDRAKNELDF